MKTVVITQSNYIPWRGYFAMIAQADELIILDSVQYTKRDWRNRNTVKTPSGALWLTIPVVVKGRYLQAVDETRIADAGWGERHIATIAANYRRARAFDEVAPWLFGLLREISSLPLLTEVNVRLITEVCDKLGISRPIRRCTDIFARAELGNMDPTDRLLNLCVAAGASHYVSGPAAKDYMDLGKFRDAGIEVNWMDYDRLPPYPQCWKGFETHLSIIDLLLNCGDRATNYLQCDANSSNILSN